MARPKINNKKDKMTLSFTEFDEDVYDFLSKKRNASAFIRNLVRKHIQQMNSNPNQKENDDILEDVIVVEKKEKISEAVTTKIVENLKKNNQEPSEEEVALENKEEEKNTDVDIKKEEEIAATEEKTVKKPIDKKTKQNRQALQKLAGKL